MPLANLVSPFNHLWSFFFLHPFQLLCIKLLCGLLYYKIRLGIIMSEDIVARLLLPLKFTFLVILHPLCANLSLKSKQECEGYTRQEKWHDNLWWGKLFSWIINVRTQIVESCTQISFYFCLSQLGHLHDLRKSQIIVLVQLKLYF